MRVFNKDRWKKIFVGAMIAACSFTGISEAAVPSEYTSAAIANYIVIRNTSLSYSDAKYLADGITYYSGMYGVDPLLMTALFETESTFNTNSVSPAGAIGIGQIMPDTAVALGVNPYDTMQNIQGACSYIHTALQTFSNWMYPTEAAVAAYNAGTKAVIDSGGVPPYYETQNYVEKIKSRYMNLQNMFGGETVTFGGNSWQDYSYVESGDETADYVEYVEKDPPGMMILDAEDY